MPLEVAAQRVHQQRLAEAARTAEEEIDGFRRNNLVDKIGLVDVYGPALVYSVEQLNAYGVASFLLHLFLCLVPVWQAADGLPLRRYK